MIPITLQGQSLRVEKKKCKSLKCNSVEVRISRRSIGLLKSVRNLSKEQALDVKLLSAQ